MEPQRQETSEIGAPRGGFDPRVSGSDMPAGNIRASSRVREARLELLGRIGQFVSRHDVDVTAMNLALVCNALSGSHGELARIFTARELSGEPIDQRWLDAMMRFDPVANARLAQFEDVMDKMDHSLLSFARTAQNAQAETADHRSAISAQFEQIGGKTGDDRRAAIEELLATTREMLDQIEQAECGFERSKEETEALRARLAEARLRDDADDLTGLPNRRAFERRFNLAAGEAQDAGKSLSVAFIEVDHFSTVVTKHGGEAGERVLCAIASSLAEITSDTCFAARNRGEEFVLLFYDMPKAEAWRKLDGIRRAQGYKQMMNRDTGKPFGKVTISAGLADVADHPDPRSALVRADNALFEARETGRNRVVSV